MLCVTGYRGVTKTLEVRERSAAMTKQMHSHREFSETRIDLYEAALSATPDQSAFEKLNEAFRAYQAAKGTLQIRDQTAVHIVSVPEIRTVERRSFTWRVFVPEGLTIQAVVKLCVDREPIDSAETLFARDLPAGESLVQMIWVEAWEPRLKSRCVLNVPDDAGLRFRVGAEEFRVEERSMEWSKTAKGEIFEETGVLFSDSPDARLGEVDGEYDLTYTKGESVQLWLQKVQK